MFGPALVASTETAPPAGRRAHPEHFAIDPTEV